MAVTPSETTATTTAATTNTSAESFSMAEEAATEGQQGPTIEVDALMEGLVLLTEFASLDSATYQSSFAYPRGSPRLGKEYPEVEHHRISLRRLEQLQAQKNVQATHLPALWRALHRLHSNLAILQENEARHATEVKELRDDLNKARRGKSKLQKGCVLLVEQNQALKKKLQEKRSLLKQARHVFRSSQELQKDLEQQNTVFKLQAHEQFLMQSARGRLESSDSNFSDADALLFPDTSNSLNILPDPTCPMSDTSERITLTRDEEDLVSLQSASSSITDEAPVLKLFAHNDEAMACSTTVNTFNSSHMSDVSEGSEDPLVLQQSCHLPGGPLKHPASPGQAESYKLDFAFGEKVALRFHAIPLHELPVAPTGVLTQEFLKEEKEGTAFTSPALLGRSLTVPESSQSLHPPTIPEEKEGGDGNRTGKQAKGQAFIVAAYGSITEDTKHQSRPTLGARVVEIDGQIVGSDWSMRKFMDVLKSASGMDLQQSINQNGERQGEDNNNKIKPPTDTPTSKEELKEKANQATIETDDEASTTSSTDGDKKTTKVFSLTFRNDALTKKQRDRLSSVEKSTRSRDRVNSSDFMDSQRDRLPSVDETSEREVAVSSSSKPRVEPMAFNLGFLRLGSGLNKDKDAKKENKNKQDSTEVDLTTRKANDEGETVKAEPPKQQQRKGKNPLFFWERGDSHQSVQEDLENRNEANEETSPKEDGSGKQDSKKENESATEEQAKETKHQEVLPESGEGDQVADDVAAPKEGDFDNAANEKANDAKEEAKEADQEKSAPASEKLLEKPPLATKAVDRHTPRNFGIPFWRTSPKPETPNSTAD